MTAINLLLDFCIEVVVNVVSVLCEAFLMTYKTLKMSKGVLCLSHIDSGVLYGALYGLW